MFNISKSKTEEKSGAESKPISIEDIENYFADFEKSFLTPRWPLAFRRSPALASSSLEMRVPDIDVVDRDKEIVVKAELPGIEKSDIDIKLTENTITIKAEKQEEKKEEKESYFHQEISRASFCRSFSLPAKVDSDNAKATFSNGMLEITLTKREPTSSKKINVT